MGPWSTHEYGRQSTWPMSIAYIRDSVHIPGAPQWSYAYMYLFKNIELHGLELQALGLDLGEVEDVGDDAQEVVARGLDDLQVRPLLGGKVCS